MMLKNGLIHLITIKMIRKRLFKDGLGGKTIIEVVVIRPKTYAYLTDDGIIKKAKGTKKCVIKRDIMFEKCLLNNKNVYR